MTESEEFETQSLEKTPTHGKKEGSADHRERWSKVIRGGPTMK